VPAIAPQISPPRRRRGGGIITRTIVRAAHDGRCSAARPRGRRQREGCRRETRRGGERAADQRCAQYEAHAGGTRCEAELLRICTNVCSAMVLKAETAIQLVLFEKSMVHKYQKCPFCVEVFITFTNRLYFVYLLISFCIFLFSLFGQGSTRRQVVLYHCSELKVIRE
jgi:hypothetical protein